jgi:hypothetical protein
MKDSAPELNVSSSETEEDKEEAKPDGEKDPDFNQVRVQTAFHCRSLFSQNSYSRPTSHALCGMLILSSLPCFSHSLVCGYSTTVLVSL